MRTILPLVTLFVCMGTALPAQTPEPDTSLPPVARPEASRAQVPPMGVHQPSEYEFGMHLFNTKDYYRAISSFKRHAFFGGDSAAADLTRYMIPLSEYAAGRFGEAVAEFRSYADHAPPGRLREASVFYQGRCWDLLGEHDAAQAVFRQADFADPSIRERAAFALGWSELNGSDWVAARTSMMRYTEAYPDGPDSGLASRIARDLSVTPPFGQKHVALGAILSIVPGGGQLYAGRTFDAINTVLMVGAATGLTIHGARDESSTALTLGVILAGTLYIANLYGGANAVAVHNTRELDSAMQSFRAELDSSSFNDYILP